MKPWYITVTIYAPYPIVHEGLYQATEAAAAASRAIKQAYKSVEHPRRIENYTIKIRRA